MRKEALAVAAALPPVGQLIMGRNVLLREGEVLTALADRLDERFCRAVSLVHRCEGNVVVSGMGKAGHIARKIVATLTSTGTPSLWLHPAEAVHGDLGAIRPQDVVIVLSQSGETEEVVRLLPSLTRQGVPLIAITRGSSSTLAAAATVVLELGPIDEACPLGLAPTASTTAMLALGDALALVVSRMRGFGREDFARFHPGGSLGRHLSRVDDYCRPQAACRIASEESTVRQVFVSQQVPGRRSGAVMLVDSEGRLSGIFTDSDLARLFERRRDAEFDGPISAVMSPRPLSVEAGSRMIEAVGMMAERKVSELPVVDSGGRPVGLIDITDVIGIFPEIEPAVDHAVGATYRIYCGPETEQDIEQ